MECCCFYFVKECNIDTMSTMSNIVFLSTNQTADIWNVSDKPNLLYKFKTKR